MTEPAYMTGPEVCALLRIDRCALKRLRFRRAFPVVVIGLRTIRYPREGVENFLEKRTVHAL